MEFTAKQLAKVLKGTVDGDPEVKVTSFAKSSMARKDSCASSQTRNMNIMYIHARPVSFW